MTPIRTRSTLTRLALGAATAIAMLGATPAMAGVIDFETVAPDFYVGGQTLSQSGYTLQVVDTHEEGNGLAGVLLDGRDPTACWLGGCPASNGWYYAGIADGALQVTRNGGGLFSLTSLDYGFVGPTGGLENYSYGQLVLTGLRADGSSIGYTLDFPGTDSAGNPLFGSAALGTDFAGATLSSLTIRACLFDGNGSCFYPHTIDDANFNQAQFAIDNLTFADAAAVPEPASLALMGLGLGALTLRRRKSASTNNNNA